MKKVLLLPLLLLAFSFAGFGQSAWVNYTSTQGHYSISFPGKPEESVEKDTSYDGSIQKINFATYAPDDNTVLMVGWIDMSANYDTNRTLQDLLEDSRDGALGSMKATDTVTTALVLTGQPYIEFTFKSSDFIGKDRIYIIDKVQYSLIALFSAKNGLSQDTDKFIHSFKRLN